MGRNVWPALLFLPTGVGIALNFTLLESSETWLQILIAVIAMGASFLAGVFSPSLGIAALLPIVMLASFAVAFSFYGVSSSDVEPIMFTIFLALIYGVAAYFAFGAGWIVRGLFVGFEDST